MVSSCQQETSSLVGGTRYVTPGLTTSQFSRGKNLLLPDLSVEQNTLQSGTTFSASIVVGSHPYQIYARSTTNMSW